MKQFSWGRAHPINTKSTTNNEKLYVGNLRSYGDSCLLNQASNLSMLDHDNIIEFNPNEGWIKAEAGLTFDKLIEFLVPRGYFLPVTPGTKFITIGGAVANDVHGKNHETSGSFGNFIIEMEVHHSQRGKIICSSHNDSDFFNATIGGIGLTGKIVWVKFSLKKIPSSYFDVETIQFFSIDEFMQINQDSTEFPYTVAWLDCLSPSSKKGKDYKGLYMRGNWSTKTKSLDLHSPDHKLSIPLDFPLWACNNMNMKIFNWLFFNKQFNKSKMALQHYEPFFYPLDMVHNWNRIYGKKGFYQFQCIIPLKNGVSILLKILNTITQAKEGSFLSVLKLFGDIKSPGLLSFPEKGITLCLDFPNKGKVITDLYQQLEDIVVENHGKMYPAKDGLMHAHSFRKFYPHWEQILPYKDPQINSDFWKRVTENKS